MPTFVRKSVFVSLALLAISPAVQSSAQVNILTNRYNTSRTAANLSETQLTPATVNTSSFGKLGQYAVDGVVYAQPLYVHGVTVNGATHNVLYVGTMHDVLYAFDADKVGSSPLWTLDFRSATVAPASIHIGASNTTDAAIADTFGIFGTPVIDLPNNRMFFVTHTLEQGAEYFRLRNVNILTGALNGSTVITGAVAALGQNAAQTFIPSKYAQRPALEIVNGQVWVAFGSRPPGDYTAPWQGWVMTYNANTLAQSGVLVTSRTSGNSIWQSGSGPAVDAQGNVYYLTGNGGTYTAGVDLPETLLQMKSSNGIDLTNWYTPDSMANNDANEENYVYLDNYDLDLSCNGPILIPGTNLVTFGSKTADVYVLNTTDLGQLTVGDPQVTQFFHVGAPITVSGNDSDRIVGMAYWQQGTGGSLFVWPGQDTLHAYSLNASTSKMTQTYGGTFALPGQPSTALAISANGSTNGIVWAPVMNTTTENNAVGQPGILHAYNASNPSQELWNSNTVAADNMGTLAKFVPPVVVNGKVYIANSASLNNYAAGSVTVYGLKNAVAPPAADFSLSANPASLTVAANSTATSNVSVADLNGFSGSVNLNVSGAPNGVITSITNSATASATLTVTASATAVASSASLQVTGTSGTLSHSISLPLTISAASTGGTSVLNTGCVFITNPTSAAGVYPVAMSASSFIAGCDMYVNSATLDLDLTGNSLLNTRTLSVVGPASGSLTSAGFTTPKATYGTAQTADPLATLPTPSASTCVATAEVVTTATTLSPGTYCGGLTITGATVKFNPGLYVVTGPLTIQGGATVIGTGVTFYLTQSSVGAFGPLSILNSTVTLSAPTPTATAGLPGVLFFGDRNWVQSGVQGVKVFASYVTADGFWYFAHTGLLNNASTIKAPTYGGLVVDNVVGQAATFSFPLANNANAFGGGLSSGPVVGNTYELTVHHTGYALTGTGTAYGSPVVQQPWNGGTSQIWKVVAGTSAGYYELQNVATGLALNISGASTSDGGVAILWPYQNGAGINDQWALNLTSTGLYNLVNENSGLSLEMPAETPILGFNSTSGTLFQGPRLNSSPLPRVS